VARETMMLASELNRHLVDKLKDAAAVKVKTKNKTTISAAGL